MAILSMVVMLVASTIFSVVGATAPYVISGTITSDDGAPLANVSIFAQPTSSGPTGAVACTDSGGRYSLAVGSGIYRLNLYASVYELLNPCENAYTPPPESRAPTDGFLISGSSSLYQNVNVVSSSVEKNFEIPSTKLTIKAVDANDNPITDHNAYAQRVIAYESSFVIGGSTTVPTGFPILLVHKTDINGEVSGYVLSGGVFVPGTICYNDGTHAICNQTTITVTNDTRVMVQPKPLAPSNLNSTSPTQNPQLSWTGVLNAQSYNVYRNNTKIDTVTTSEYTDLSSPEGANSYYVTTINGNESTPSNGVNVVVDRTSPQIHYSVSPNQNSGGWNKTNVVVTFTCDDESSGIKSCSDPITLSNQGVGQSVTGTVIDNAGNSNTVLVSNIKIDKTAPTISNPTMSNSFIISSAKVTLGAKVADNLSGIARGEYYIDVDPGQGNGTAMTYGSNKLNVNATIGNLGLGIFAQHKLYMRTMDVAGNWSAPVSTNFTYTNINPVLAFYLILKALF